jgi:hypothetical protein
MQLLYNIFKIIYKLDLKIIFTDCNPFLSYLDVLDNNNLAPIKPREFSIIPNKGIITKKCKK